MENDLENRVRVSHQDVSKDAAHHAPFSYEDSGKITLWCLIIRNNPASRFDLEGTMIHTADCVSLTALPPENAEPDL